jgi:hypothetical protein
LAEELPATNQIVELGRQQGARRERGVEAQQEVCRMPFERHVGDNQTPANAAVNGRAKPA